MSASEGGLPQRQWREIQRPTSRAVKWTQAALFTAVALLVLVGALGILVVVALGPRAPYVAVRGASLDALLFNFTGPDFDNPETSELVIINDLDVSLLLEAHNDRDHDAVIFSHLEIRLLFANTTAMVRAKTFRVPPGGTLPLPTVATARDFTLDKAATTFFIAANEDRNVPFVLDGEARTHRRVTGRIAMNQMTLLNCHVQFFWPNASALPFVCSSNTHYLFW